MFEYNSLSTFNSRNICCGCLKMSEDVHRMTPDEINSYQTCMNKFSSVRTDKFVCTICAYLFKKFNKLVNQWLKADSILNNIISEDNKVEFCATPMKLVYNISLSDVRILNCSNFDKNLDTLDTATIFDHDIYIDEEDVPLVMFKTEDKSVKKKKKKWKNGKIKDNKDFIKLENGYGNSESDDKISINTDNNIDIDIKLEQGKKKKKKELRDGFTSRMVQETDEYTVIKLSKEQVLEEMLEKSKSEEYLRSLYKCEKCVKGFNFEDVLTTHMERHAMKKGWLFCDLCQQYCPSVISLRGHMKSHTTRYKCKVCGCVRLSRQVLLEHYATCHTSDAVKYTCQLCDFVSNKRTSMQRHVRTRHNKTDKHTCDQCGKTMNSLEALRVHTTRHDKSKRVKCDECDRWFVYPSLLQQHKMAVHVRDDYYCVECDIKFKSRENLSLHFKRNKRHRDISTFRYECDHCGKRFMFVSALTSHLSAAHGNGTRHPCECGRVYSSRDALRAHAHTKHADLVCTHCQTSFTRKSVLRSHMRTHTGERPFACECGASFAQQNTLAAHAMAKHHQKDEEVSLLQNPIPNNQTEVLRDT